VSQKHPGRNPPDIHGSPDCRQEAQQRTRFGHARRSEAAPLNTGGPGMLDPASMAKASRRRWQGRCAPPGKQRSRGSASGAIRRLLQGGGPSARRGKIRVSLARQAGGPKGFDRSQSSHQPFQHQRCVGVS